MDTVKLHQAGFTNTVGISGTALTKEHIRFLSRLTQKLYLCLDTDKAGINATFSSLDSLLGEEIDTRIIHIGWGKDPDEFIESGGDFKQCIADAISPVQFYIDAGSTRFDLSSFVGKTQILREVLKYVRRMKNAIEADMAIQSLAKALGVSKDTVLGEYREIKPIKPNVIAGEKLAWPDLWHILVGYLSAYKLYDLFFDSIVYTDKHFAAIPSYEFLLSHLKSYKLNEDIADIDELKALELQIESENEWTQREAILIKFRELIRCSLTLMCKHEHQAIEDTMDQNSIEYIQAHSSLLSKRKKLGLI